MEPEYSAVFVGGTPLPTALPAVEEEVPGLPPAPRPTIVILPSPKLRRIFSRDLVILPVVFAVALLFFYVVLNFNSVWGQLSAFFVRPPKNNAVVLGQDLTEYQSWIKKYYVYSSDPDALAPNEDADRDGLKNIDEFYLGTNPLDRDTNGNGASDGQDVLQGGNPLYVGPLTGDQQNVLEEHVDTRDIGGPRGDLGPSGGIDAGGSIGSGLSVRNGELPNMEQQSFVIEPTKAGNLKIPRLGVDIAIVWSQDFSDMEEDLKWGVAHHPATVYPGYRGLSSIHGHSSGYPWDGKYKTALTKINYLEAGDEVFVTVFNTAGEERGYRYIVRSKQVYNKDDAAQLAAPADGHFLNLSTSWPIGTARERYVVTTELTGM